MVINSYALEGKQVLITGAAKRIGRSLALACAKAGADIIIHYNHSESDAQSLKDEIENIGRRANLVQAELSNLKDVEKIIPVVSKNKALYGLVNNASVFQPIDWQTMTLDDWQYHMDVNLTAPFLLSKNFAQSIGKEAHGRIINILDWRALRPGVDHFPYTISKAALAALTRSLAISFAPHITVNGIALGAILPAVDTISRLDINHNNAIISVPQQRWGDIDEVCQTTLFLLAGPSYITGEIIHIDGGRHLI